MQALTVLAFRLGQQYYALPITQVIEVAAMVSYARLPNAADGLLGVVNRQGSNLLLLDLRQIFGWPAPPVTLTTFFIVAGDEANRAGLVVDEVVRVQHIRADQSTALTDEQHFVSHVLNDGEDLFQLVKLSQIIHTYVRLLGLEHYPEMSE